MLFIVYLYCFILQYMLFVLRPSSVPYVKWIENEFILLGLYIGAHGLYTSEVIHLKRKFGQWKEDSLTKEPSNLEFYEYVEALKITGDPYVPAGQVTS